MKKGFILISTFTILVLATMITSDYLWAKTRFLDSSFAKELCKQWNNSQLPKKLGSSGTKWVNTGGRNKQILIVFARDCKNPKVQLTIEDQGGKAICTYGGKKKNRAHWQFGPKTKQWKKWAKRWSAMNMPALMSTFKGNITVAKKNLKNFGLFWKAAAVTVNETGSGYGCN